MKITKLLRFLLIAVAAVMVFSLFACTETPAEPEEPDNSIEESKPETNETDPKVPGEDSEDTSEESSETPACEHVEEVVAGTAATCETAGLTDGKKCSVCGETLVAQEEIPALGHAWNAGEITTAPTCETAGVKTFTCANDATHTYTEDVAALGHNVTVYTQYVANPDSDEAMIAGACANCSELIAKPASFYLAIETIYGNVNNDNVVVFQADSTIAPLMGMGQFVFTNGHPNYPANGFSPIALDCAALGGAFNGMIGVAGWTGYLGSAVADSAVFKIIDADGNEIVGWTAVTQLTPNASDAGVDEFLETGYADAAVSGYRFAHVVDFKPYWGAINGKTVTVVMAFTTSQGVDGDVCIPYANIELVVPTCAHVAGAPDTADACNVKCTLCGTLMEANKHSMSAWTVDANAPQTEVATCACGHKETRAATTTLAGLTVYTPDALLALPGNGGYVGSVVVDEVTGMKYFRAVSAKDATEGNININDYEKTQTPIANVGNFAFLIVRKNVGEATIQLMTNKPSVTTGVTSGRVEPQIGIGLGDDFQIIIFDVSSKVEDGKLGWLRIDLINGSKSTAGVDTVDVAVFGFAATKEEAYAYFKAYIGAYALKCNHIPDKTIVTTDNEGEIAMTCVVCQELCNVMACPHADLAKLTNVTAKATAGDNIYYTADCALCGGTQVDVPSLTQEGSKVFTPAELNSIAIIQAAYGLESNAGFGRYSAELVTDEETGLTYVRFVSKVTAEGCLFLNDGKSALLGVNDYVAVLYRKTGSAGNFEFHSTPEGTTNTAGISSKLSGTLVADGTWQLAIIHANAITTDGYGWTRIDVFNNAITVGDQVDIAYIGFFSDSAAAYDYFKGYLGVVDCFHQIGDTFSTTGKVDEMKGNCIICNEEMVVACTHPEKVVVATDDPTTFNLTCQLCGKEEVTKTVNDQNLTMFAPEDIYNRGKADGGSSYSVTQMTEGELTFVRFELLADKAKSSEFYFWIANASDPDITGVSDYFMIVYRMSEGHSKNIDAFISNDDSLNGTHNRNRTFINNNEWVVAVFDFSGATGYDDTKNVVSRFRLDIFNNNEAIAKGEYLDIAYMGFFSSADKAFENYFKAVEKYDFEAANFKNTFDAIKVNGTNVRDNTAIVTKKDVENGTWIANLQGQTLESVNSLTLAGWVVTPGGASSISYVIVDAEGNESELKELLKPSVITSTNGIAGATTGMVYGDGRYNGCSYQGNTATIDLSGYEGQTVTVKVYVVTNNGQMGNTLDFINVTVPGTPAAE